jgi:hypothetical protein
VPGKQKVQPTYRICEATGKRGYGSAKAARDANKGVSNRFRVFPCPMCRDFHVTSELESEHEIERLRERDRRPRRDAA